MNSNSWVKVILFTFFAIFFGFLFWYFYNPSEKPAGDNSSNERGWYQNLFPFGGGGEKDTPDEGKERDNKEKEKETLLKREIMPRLRQISDIPTAGVYMQSLKKTEIFNLNRERKRMEKLDLDSQYSEIRYISQRNSHIYSSYDFTSKIYRISNVTIPKVFEAKFMDKNNIIIRYRDDFAVKTYMVTLKDKSEEEMVLEKEKDPGSFDPLLKKFEGLFFPDNILDIYFNGSGVYYTTLYNQYREKDGKIHGILTNRNSENKKEIFSNSLREWNFSFNNPNKIAASNKVSSDARSVAFSLDVKNGRFDNLGISEIALNILPNYNFTKIAYTFKDRDGEFKLYVKNLKSGEVKDLEISTLIEKCVWDKDNINLYCAVPTQLKGKDQPDDWYKGKVYFKDDILKIDTDLVYSEIVFDSLLENKNFDVIDLKIDDRGKYLYWIDKVTDYAWSYDMDYREEEGNSKS